MSSDTSKEEPYGIALAVLIGTVLSIYNRFVLESAI